LLDVASGEEVRNLPNVTGCLGFSPDGKLVAVSKLTNLTFDKRERGLELQVWDLATGHKVRTLTFKGHSGPFRVAFNKDGKRLATALEGKKVMVWDLATGQEIFTLGSIKGSVADMAFSPDGARLAVASGVASEQGPSPRKGWGEVRVWDIASAKELLTLKGHTNLVKSVAFSPDGKRLATGSDDKTVRVWEAVSGQGVLTLREHTDGVLDVVFSPDGKRLAGVSRDTITIWDGSLSMKDADPK
jgi:WD40 repeat protein